MLKRFDIRITEQPTCLVPSYGFFIAQYSIGTLTKIMYSIAQNAVFLCFFFCHLHHTLFVAVEAAIIPIKLCILNESLMLTVLSATVHINMPTVSKTHKYGHTNL